MELLFGRDAKMYRNTASYGTPTWVAMDNIGDVSDDLNHEQVEVPLRSSGNINRFFYGNTSMSLTINTSNIKDDATLAAIWDAFRNKTTLDLLVLDRAKEDAEARGFRCEFGVFGHPRDQAVKSVQSSALALVPVISSNPVVFYPIPEE
jgi:hypothetical protein